MEIELKQTVLSAARWLLRPVIRMMLRHGVMHREFMELSKEVYVEVARKEYGLRGRPTNVSRTALLTGLDRKEVSRLKNTLERVNSVGQVVHRQDRVSRVLAGWYQDDDYTDDDGKPLLLPMHGPGPSYEDLVRRYGGDVAGITILRELKRVEAIRVRGTDKVEVLRRNYRLDTADPDAISRVGSVLADIGETVTHNLYHDEDELSRFEARASNPCVPPSALPDYRQFIYTESQIFLEKVDAWLTAHEIAGDAIGTEKAVRLGIGMYWIQNENVEVGAP